MAVTNRLSAARILSGAVCTAVRTKPRIVRARGGAGFVGVPATPDPGARDLANRENEVSVLARLIEGQEAGAVAARLIQHFASLPAVLQACADGQSVDLPEQTIERLAVVREALRTSLVTEAVAQVELGSLDALMRYLRYDMIHRREEVFRALFLDGKNRIIDDRNLWVGTVDAVQVHPREITRLALELGAVALVVAHNHPTADAWPSPGDKAATARILQACLPLGIRLNDHLIVARNGCYSMRRDGLLDRLEREWHTQSQRYVSDA